MKVLVTGATGTVGSLVLQILLAERVPVRAMTRSESRLGLIPSGTETILANLAQPDTLATAFEGCDAVFLMTALDPNEAQNGLAGVAAAKAAGVKKVVFLSVQHAEQASQIPHFASKLPVQQALRESGMAHVFLQPNNFFQNDLLFQQALTGYRVYPQPIGTVGLNRVDARDIADAAAIALTQDVENGGYPIVGPDLLTGPGTAAAWGKALGSEIWYGGDDLAAWTVQSSQMLPAWLVRDLRIMYDHFQKHGLKATDEDFARQSLLLGHPPRAFESFTNEAVQLWRARAGVTRR